MSPRPTSVKPKEREDAHPWSMAEIVVIVVGVLVAAMIGVAETRLLPG